MEVVLTTAARRRAMIQSNRHHQQTNTQFFTDRMPFLTPNQQCQSTEGNALYCSNNIFFSIYYLWKTGNRPLVNITQQFKPVNSSTASAWTKAGIQRNSILLWWAWQCSRGIHHEKDELTVQFIIQHRFCQSFNQL